MDTTKFNGTVEFLKGRPGVAIVAIFDLAGEWHGAGRVEIRSTSREALYEACYLDASGRAARHGGRLETFRVMS